MLDGKYIGIKIISAAPMNRLEYNKYRNWELPKDEDGTDEGYLVEYHDGGQSNHPNHAGYISWSPKDVFERSHQKDELNFSGALFALRLGHAVTRKGWNGKGMFIYLVPEASYPAQTGVAKKYWGEKSLVPYGGYIAMKTDQENVVPWLASQTDILADDWQIVELV